MLARQAALHQQDVFFVLQQFVQKGGIVALRQRHGRHRGRPAGIGGVAAVHPQIEVMRERDDAPAANRHLQRQRFAAFP